jgi:DNA-binding protein H-NS
MASKVNLSGMDVTALMELRSQIEERLVENRTELEKQLKMLGGTRAVDGSGNKLKGRKVPAKYRLGQRTWSGRGMRPKWLTEELKKNKKLKLNDLLIDKSGAQKRA